VLSSQPYVKPAIIAFTGFYTYMETYYPVNSGHLTLVKCPTLRFMKITFLKIPVTTPRYVCLLFQGCKY